MEKIDKRFDQLIKNAIEIMSTAYVPYSKFHVGASILDRKVSPML